MPTIPTHTPRPWIKEPEPFGGMRDKNYSLYNSKRWRMAAKAHRAKHPLCVVCASNGITTLATTTDHITPINEGGAIWDSRNWQSLCSRCNAIKTGKQRKNK